MKKIILVLLITTSLCVNVFANDVINQIEKNWNSQKTISGLFEQVDPDGNISSGEFFFLKPFQSKFHYNNKAENIITNESLLRIVDSEGYQIESYAIGNNILKKILSETININDQFNVISFTSSDNFHLLSLKVKGEESNSKVHLYFDADSLDLKKWEIYDEFGNKTVLEFTKIKKNIFISQNLFVVRYR